MKKIRLITYLLITLFLSNNLRSFSQGVAVNADGSAAHSSAMLDIKSNNKGLLIPRMTTIQRTAIASPANGLMVYDTNANGYWYFNGTVWVNLSLSGSTGWALTGNGGTNPATHFLGTIDDQPLLFRVNNIRHGYLGSSIFLGSNAGLSNTAIGNIGIGTGALPSNTVGNYNIAIGTNALLTNTTGNANTAIGNSSLYSNNGNLNTATGYESMISNTSGGNNSAYGSYALRSNNLGSYNSSFGVASLYDNTNGLRNTAVGAYSLRYSVGGYDNTSVGSFSLYKNNSYYNSALGSESLYFNESGHDNTGLGYRAMYNNSTGSYNTSVGAFSMVAGDGNENTAIGYKAMETNGGSRNTAVGLHTLRSNTSGSYNTVSGYGAMFSNTNGYYNTASGHEALGLNVNGDNNVGLGFWALRSNTSGNSNTAIGNEADNDDPNLSYNTIIGAYAHIDNGSNSVAIGYNSFTNVNNLALLGSATTTQVGGYATWSNWSDSRFKRNINENVKGLDFILQLRPVTYQMDVLGLYNFWGKSPYGISKEKPDEQSIAHIDDAIRKKESIVTSGFLAQEVELAAKTSGYNFSGVIPPQHDKDHYRIAYSDFVVPLVKAVQEQQNIIEKQQELIDKLLKRVEALENK